MFLVGDRRKEYDARRPGAAEIFRPGLAQVFIKLFRKGRQALGAAERLVEAEEGEDRTGLDPRQPFLGRTEILRAGPHRHFVAGEAKIAHHQPVRRIARVDHRLQPAVMLHAVGQRIADERDVLARVGRKRRGRGRPTGQHTGKETTREKTNVHRDRG